MLPLTTRAEIKQARCELNPEIGSLAKVMAGLEINVVFLPVSCQQYVALFPLVVCSLLGSEPCETVFNGKIFKVLLKIFAS